MFIASENIDFTGLSHVFLLGGGEGGMFSIKLKRKVRSAQADGRSYAGVGCKGILKIKTK